MGFQIYFHGVNPQNPPEYRKGKSGRFLRRPRQHKAAATVEEYYSAVHSKAVRQEAQ